MLIGRDELLTEPASCSRANTRSPHDPAAGRSAATPVVIDGCFGWLHERHGSNDHAAGRGADVALLLCPALAWEAMYSHHGMRLLADACAAAGYPTLRIGYPGTGDGRDVDAVRDGAGRDGTAEHWSAWQCFLNGAADWLREATGARELVLVGLRIGGTLATLVAESRDDVAGLILLAPVLRGHSYLRQLAVEAQMEAGAGGNALAGGLDFHELQLSAETVGRIGQVDLRHARLGHVRHVAIFQQDPTRLIDACAQAWTARGSAVSRHGFEGLQAMVRQNIHGDDSPIDLHGVTSWLQDAIPARPRLRAADGSDAIASPTTGPAILRLPGCIETPLRFGPGERLFGILCQPAPGQGEGGVCDTAVIIGNTGRDPHVGIARFGVEFARRLAAAGIASLRMDFAGLGDSLGPAGSEHVLSALFDAPREPDFAAAVDLLQGLGFASIAVQGLCSGAYHALRAAVADARIDTVLLVNCPIFDWQAGDTVEAATRKLTSPSEYVRKLARSDVRQQLVRGHLAFRRILRAQLARLAARALDTARGAMAALGMHVAPRCPARHAMATLAGRGARTLFLFSPGDAGIRAVEQAFGAAGAGLRRYRGTEMHIVPQLDHVLSRAAMRRIAADRMIAFLADLPDAALRGTAGRS
jgi:alpha/beta superfamily hydrolase